MRTHSRLRLCTSDGAFLEELGPNSAEPQLSVENFSARRQNIYTAFVAKTGTLPTPKSADTIGRLLGTPVKASDGKSYPQPSQDEKAAARELANQKRAYHSAARQKKNVMYALECLNLAGDPSALAIHMKNDPQVSRVLDPALKWMIRFAEEWRSHEQSRF